MFIIPLIVYVIVVFLTLWVADLYLTIKSVKKIGKEIEINPIMKKILGLRSSHLWTYKAIEVIVFGALTQYVGFREGPYMLSILYGLIFVYALVVAQGLHIYSRIYKSIKPAIILFVILILYTLFFINLNFNLFSNTITLSQTIDACNSEYVDLYSECRGEAPPKEFAGRFDLNLFLPGGG